MRAVTVLGLAGIALAACTANTRSFVSPAACVAGQFGECEGPVFEPAAFAVPTLGPAPAPGSTLPPLATLPQDDPVTPLPPIDDPDKGDVANIGIGNTGSGNIGIDNSGDFNIGIGNSGWSTIGIGNSGTGSIGIDLSCDNCIGIGG